MPNPFKRPLRGMLFAGAACAILIGAATAQTTKSFSGDQQAEIESIVKDYLIKNPDVVVKALEAYRAQQEEHEARAFKDKVADVRPFMTSKDAPSAGNPNGDVTVVEFFDYNCGYCKHAVDEVVQLIEQDKNVRVVFHEFPILSESSADAARFALAANKQGKYFEFHQALMKFPGQKNASTYETIAKKLGMDYARLEKDANSQEIKQLLVQNMDVGRTLGINGTPAFVFGDTLVPGAISLDDMKQLVADNRKKKG